MEFNKIPSYLERYIAEQDYSLYTNEDQAVWRFIMRQLYDFLKTHAHDCYADGLKKTGLSIDSIPKISEMDAKLKEFGWRAVPVSGFIPPAAFMSFQAERILPIACEIRSMDHILYTPAPDIVHEAAGHAPILIDQNFTDYLTSYGEVASKAIISSEDLALYEAIRDLSDIKESPTSTLDEIKKAEEHLNKVSESISYVSEAQYLGRMNWWTAEYGLIGSMEKPKIYGAGLLSSISESKNSLTKPEHIRFSRDCLNYNYDITEQQPQLFVVEKFDDLITALEDIQKDMAFSHGGVEGLKKAKEAASVCTVELEDGSTYSGVLESFETEGEKLQSFKVQGPCLVNDKDLHESGCQKALKNPLKVKSVYGGPTSFEKYPEYSDFAAKKITKNPVHNQKAESLLARVKEARNSSDYNFDSLKKDFLTDCSHHWLCGLELLELKDDSDIREALNTEKENSQNPEVKTCIELGLNLI